MTTECSAVVTAMQGVYSGGGGFEAKNGGGGDQCGTMNG
jgi:hypothetical protein